MQLLTLAALLGLLFPPFIAIIQQEKWPSSARAIATVILCAAASGLTVWGKGDLHGYTWPTVDELATVFVGMLIATYGSFAFFWKQLLGGRLMSAVEHSTSFSVLAAWWKSNHQAASTLAASVLTPAQLDMARQLIAAEQAAAERARVQAAISAVGTTADPTVPTTIQVSVPVATQGATQG